MRDPIRWARSVMPGSPSESLLALGVAWSSNPMPSSLTSSRRPSLLEAQSRRPHGWAAAWRSIFEIASWAIRKSANSTVGGSRRSVPVTPNEVSNWWRSPASARI